MPAQETAAMEANVIACAIFRSIIDMIASWAAVERLKLLVPIKWCLSIIVPGLNGD